MGLLLTRLRIARIDVRARNVRDAHGIRIGDGVRKLRHAYGTRLSVHKAPYTLNALYELRERNRKLEFFINKHGTIDSISAGRIPEIDYEEGCV